MCVYSTLHVNTLLSNFIHNRFPLSYTNYIIFSKTFYPTISPTFEPSTTPSISSRPSLILLFPSTRQPSGSPTGKPVWIPIFAKTSKLSKSKSSKSKSAKVFSSKSSKKDKSAKSSSSSSSRSRAANIQYLQALTDFTPIGNTPSAATAAGGMSWSGGLYYLSLSVGVMTGITFGL